MERFSARRLTRAEKVLKREIDAYHVSDVDNTAVIYVGTRALSLFQAVDLPDAVCEGLTYKQRVVKTERGHCLLLARWKPERHMRRATTAWSQKWFVEKELFPPDAERFLTRLERRAQEAAEVSEPEEKPAAEEEATDAL
jgi:hypothetical protein